MTGRAYGIPYGDPVESRYQTARRLAENERRRAVANRCTGRRKSTATNPLPHVWLDEAGGALKSCKHCRSVRDLTNAEYRAKFGVDRPPPLPGGVQTSGVPGQVVFGILLVVLVLVVILVHNARGH